LAAILYPAPGCISPEAAEERKTFDSTFLGIVCPPKDIGPILIHYMSPSPP